MSDIKVTKEVAKREVPPPTLFNELFTPMVPFGKLFGLSPFALMREFTNEMDNIFKGITPKAEAEWFAPLVDVKLADGNMIVTADLPGLKKEEVKIEVTDTALVIEGERKLETKEEKEGYTKVERNYGKFYRSIPLPEGAKIDLAKAELKDGVLTVSLPVPEAKKGRQVPIEEGAKIKTKAA